MSLPSSSSPSIDSNRWIRPSRLRMQRKRPFSNRSSSTRLSFSPSSRIRPFQDEDSCQPPALVSIEHVSSDEYFSSDTDGHDDRSISSISDEDDNDDDEEILRKVTPGREYSTYLPSNSRLGGVPSDLISRRAGFDTDPSSDAFPLTSDQQISTHLSPVTRRSSHLYDLIVSSGESSATPNNTGSRIPTTPMTSSTLHTPQSGQSDLSAQLESLRTSKRFQLASPTQQSRSQRLTKHGSGKMNKRLLRALLRWKKSPLETDSLVKRSSMFRGSGSDRGSSIPTPVSSSPQNASGVHVETTRESPSPRPDSSGSDSMANVFTDSASELKPRLVLTVVAIRDLHGMIVFVCTDPSSVMEVDADHSCKSLFATWNVIVPHDILDKTQNHIPFDIVCVGPWLSIDTADMPVRILCAPREILPLLPISS